jgi:hypothetical protein
MVVTASGLYGKVATLLLRHGRDITVTSKTDSYDAATGTNTPTSTSHTVRATPPLSYEVRYIDGNTIRQGDVQFIFSASGLSFTPKPGLKITDGSKVYYIVSVRPDTYDYDGDTATFYTVQARGDG